MALPKNQTLEEKYFYSEPKDPPTRNYGGLTSVPLITTPFTPVEGSMHTFQELPQCRDFELRAVKCIDAYGWYRTNEKCGLLMKDMYECVFRAKQSKRLYLITKEHRRQIASGEREYLPTPRIDLL